jgi:hypothetical protein
MAVVGVSASEILIVLALLFGGTGIPLGMPPQPHDPFMDGVAPQQCIVYSSWNGLAVPLADADNETERMLAEPEIQELVKSVEQTLRTLIAREAGGNEEQQLIAQTIPDLVKLLLTQPTTIYLSSVGVGPQGPTASGAIVVKGDNRLAATFARLRRMFGQSTDEVDELLIRGTKFYRYSMGNSLPPLYLATHKGYLIISSGDGSAIKLMTRLGNDTPEWLVEARAALPVERRSTISYIDIARIRALGKQFGGPQVSQAIQAFGLDDVESLISTSGLEGNGSLQTIRIKTDPNGRLKKLLDSFQPLTAADFTKVPADAVFSNIANIDLAAVLEFVQESIGLFDPSAEQAFEQSLEQIEQALGFNPKRDLADAVGDRWTLYTSPDTGLYTGLVLSVEVDDFQKLNRVIFTLLGMMQARPDVSVTNRNIDGTTVYSLSLHEQFPFSPSFSLTEKELLISLFPQPIHAHLTRPAGENLASVKNVASRLEGGQALAGLMYIDTKRVTELAYPAAQLAFSSFSNMLRDDGIELSPWALPTAGAILRHVENSVSSVSVVEDGIVIDRRQQFPGGSIVASAAFSLGNAVPAIFAARESAQRQQGLNKLRQIGISFHNYHEAFKGFPIDSYDADGKPLLSWRVHILPFVEQQALYEQFHLDEPWDSEHNKKLIAQMPRIYFAPGSELQDGRTVYLTPTGKGTINPPRDENARNDQGKFPTGIRFRDILDGTSNTIMVVEASDKIAVPWSKPADYQLDPKAPTADLIGLHKKGFQASLCDGSVQFISEFVDVGVLNALFTRAGGEIVPNF